LKGGTKLRSATSSSEISFIFNEKGFWGKEDNCTLSDPTDCVEKVKEPLGGPFSANL